MSSLRKYDFRHITTFTSYYFILQGDLKFFIAINQCKSISKKSCKTFSGFFLKMLSPAQSLLGRSNQRVAVMVVVGVG